MQSVTLSGLPVEYQEDSNTHTRTDSNLSKFQLKGE